MPFSGAGIFNRIYQWVNDAANDLDVSSTRMDTDSNDIADGLTNCVTRDGQSPALANLPMNNFKFTGLSAGSASTDSVNFGQVFTTPNIFTGAVTFNGGITGSGPIAFAGATSVTVPTATLGDNTTKAASTAFVQQAAFAAALPVAPGGAQAYYIDSTAGVSSWKLYGRLARSPRVANTVLGLSDLGTWVDITAGTFSQTFAAVATLGAGWWCYLGNSGTGDITLDPSGAETIDGLATYVMYPGELRIVHCDGTALRTVVVNAFAKTFTTTGPFVKPPGYQYFDGELWNGGNSGGRAASINIEAFGGAGGGCFPFELPAALFGASETITIGDGGAANTTSGGGSVGGVTSIGTLLTLTASSAYNIGSSVNGTAVATPDGFAAGSVVTSKPIYGGAATAGASPTIGANSIFGGAAGGGVSDLNVAFAGGTSKFGGNGGAGVLAASGVNGTAPGGGGGATQTGPQSGAGARGEARIRGRV